LKGKSIFFFSTLLFLSTLSSSGQDLSEDIAINEWRVHIPYGNVTAIADAGDKIFCATKLAMFVFNKSDNSVERFSKVTGLSDIDVSTLGYDVANDLVVLAYNNGNVDVIKGNKITNISDIRRKNIVGDKRVYNIYFYNDLAYLSCGFGIVVLDLINNEIKDTYFIGTGGDQIRVNAITSLNDRIFAATENGILEADINDPFLNDPTSWFQHGSGQNISSGECKQTIVHEQKIYAIVKDTVYELGDSTWSNYYFEADKTIRSVMSSQGKLYISQVDETTGQVMDGKVVSIDSQQSKTEFQHVNLIIGPESALEDINGVVWVADSWMGLIKYNGSNYERIAPNSPPSVNVREITIENNEVWVAPGEISNLWNYLFNTDGFFSFRGNYWGVNASYNTPGLDTILDFITSTIHPSNRHVFMGSYGGGLVEFFDDKLINVYKQNSSLQETVGDANSYRVGGLAFDDDGNLWVSNFGAPNPISVRKADGTWKAFDNNLDVTGNPMGPMVIDDNNQKWIVRPKSFGILVFDHGENIDDTSDDRYRALSTGEGKGGLPNIDVLCIAKDLDGEIWVGTKQGIAVFYCPSEVMSSDGCDADQILVDEGGFLGFLMETESVNTIAVDGADRKWIGTENGIWLMSSDGTNKIRHFNVDNSPLLSNSIIDIAINHETGEVFIGTAKGIISYKGTATEGKDSHGDVYVYPNPVKEDYTGTIAIKGLVKDAFVKITDVSGTLIYQTQALGGLFN